MKWNTQSPKLFYISLSCSTFERVRWLRVSFIRLTEKGMEENLLAEERRKSETPSLTRVTFTRELKRLGSLAGPMVAVTLTQYMLEVISMMMVGHLGELALSSTAIATSLSAATGFSLLVSLSCLSFVFFLAIWKNIS